LTPLELVLSKLPDARRNGTGWAARCPGHDDERPSLSIAEGDAGRALLHCYAGCTLVEITAALGLELSDLTPPRAKPVRRTATKPTARTGGAFATADDAVAALEQRHGPRAAAWVYYDAAGEPVGVVVRWNLNSGNKDIRPVARQPGGRWKIGAMTVPRPLYRLPELLTCVGDRVFVAEGEKATDALTDLGFLATTSAGGAKAARQSDWSPLAGRDVVILPDADEPGRHYAADVARILSKSSPRRTIRIVDLPDLPPAATRSSMFPHSGRRDWTMPKSERRSRLWRTRPSR
jgi:putative DNA primase/helicase